MPTASRSLVRSRLLVVVLAVALAAAACGGGDPGAEVEDAGSLDDVPAFAESTTTTAAARPTSELALLTQPAGSAATLPDATTGPVPVAMTFDAISATAAPIVGVGVEPNGDMEIPGASEIGWYRYGPSPGAGGSAVLAAHISWNGRDGVFRRLAQAQPGQRFTLGYDDGSLAEYEVVAVRQYDKDALPTAEIFTTSGEPQVVLITCGGSFNRSLNSYDDNIVVYAVPV